MKLWPLFLVISCLFCLGCRHAISPGQLDSKYSEAIDDLYTTNNFAFKVDGHEYYFAPLEIEESGFRCTYYLGFKDESLKYKFLAKDLDKLKNIYGEKIEIRAKMKKALVEIEKLSQKNECNYETGYKHKGKVSETVDSALTLVVFSPFIVVSVFFGADVYFEAFKENALDHKLKKIRLGMPPAEVKNILGLDLKETQSENIEIHQFKKKPRDLVFVYENSELMAYVWGYSR
jgi:hypothetical protein